MASSRRENVFDRQLKLQVEAGHLLDRLGILEQLKTFGDVHLIGSAALGMLTQRDLDYDVLTKEKTNFDSVLSFADGLIRQHPLWEVIVRDNHKDQPPNQRAVLRSGFGVAQYAINVPLWERLPSGIFLKVIAEHQEPDQPVKAWRLDICFLQQDQQRSINHRDELAKRLTDNDRGVIMRIKDIVARDPAYHRGFSGPDVYDAVLNHKVKGVNGFWSYIENKANPT